MAVTVIPAETMPPQFSADAGATWLTPVCINDWTFDGSTTTNEEETFCGKFTSVGAAGGTGTVNALASTTPEVGELSAEQALAWWVAKTSLLFRTQLPASGTPGTDFYINVPALITNFSVNGPAGQNVHYSFTFATQGTIDNTP